MDKKPKSRRELRKEGRKEKNQKKFDSWIQKQKTQKEKKLEWKSKQKKAKVLEDSSVLKPRDGDDFELDVDDERHNMVEKPSTASKVVKRTKGTKKATNSKFEEYLAMEGMKRGSASAEEDLELERRLAKKLKVKGNRLGGMDDGMDMFLEGLPSAIDSFEQEPTQVLDKLPNKKSKTGSSSKKRKKIKSPEKDQDSGSDLSGETTVAISEPDEACYEAKQSTLQQEKRKKSKVKLDASEVSNSSTVKSGKQKKTKFEKYLELTKQGGSVSAEADLYLERKLAKKLKVKNGKLGGLDDDINTLIEGIPSALDMLGSEEGPSDEALMKSSADKSSRKKRKRVKASEQEPEEKVARDTVDVQSEPAETSPSDRKLEKAPAEASGLFGNVKYVAPHLRSRDNESDSQIRRRVRGLLNRLSESNVESITGEMSTIFRSLPRVTGSQIITEEILASCSGGPRGSEQYAAVFAAFVAGMSCLVGIDFGAKVLASLAKCFEDEYRKEDNLSLRNVTLLLSYLYILGVCSSDVIYDFMIMLSKQLMETDVSTILTILQSCGMNLRGDDPVAMKDFVLSIQTRANELKSSENDGQSISSKRMEFMLETICDIKNNKRKAKEDTPQHTRIKKWLQKLGVEQILIRGLKWSKLLDPNKKGQWWASGDFASTTSNVEEVANTIDKESLEAQKLLQLAAAQRMNTDVRRAIFCIIMSGEDYVDAFEKLLRLNLQGKQDREITRVLVECCLQENVFNKYYCVLATKLCSYDKNHRMSLQNCLWDQFEQLDSMELSRSSHLAQFVAEMLVSFTLSLAVLKKVDFSDPRQLTNRRIVHFRMLFQALFKQSDSLVWNIFTRIAPVLELEPLRTGIEFFIKQYVVGAESSLANKFKIARKALANLEGILM